VGALALVLLIGGAGAAYVFVPQVKALVGGGSDSSGSSDSSSGSAQSSDTSKQPSTAGGLPPAVEAVLPRWRIMFVDAGESDSKQLLSEGQALLAKDQRLAYSQATELFQRALLLDPKSDEAIGGYVQALALGLGARMDDKTFQEARGLIEAAEERANRAPDLLAAHANLLFARPEQPNVDQARKLAEEVLANPKDSTVGPKAEAHLILGRVFLHSSRELANQHFDSALAIASDLHRVHYYRALADETSGDYPQAIERLEKRLTQDPDHWETRTTLARIYLEVGDVDRARELYESRLKMAPGDFQAMLSLAVIRYQVEGGVPGALGALRGMLRNREKYDEREVSDLLLHQATAERVSNNLDAATKSARESAELVKDNPAARLQLFLISVARKDAAAAAGHLTTLRGQLGEPVLEKLLEGRLRLLERKPAEAMALFMEATRMDARRMDALLLAGVAAAQEGRRDEAFRSFAQVVQSDPLRLAPRPVVTPFFVRSADLLDGLEGSIMALSRGDEDLLAHLYEGVLRFHQGDAAAAEKTLKQVNDVDDNNAPASAYRAFLALGRKDLKAAQAHAARAVVGGRQVAIAHLAQGLVLAADAKQQEPAKKSLRDAVTLSPKLYSAEVKLGELEGNSNRNAVREKLVRLLGLDPSYLPAKRVLYLLDKRG
jgi:tetratricopeptide (TPR) repeat protein